MSKYILTMKNCNIHQLFVDDESPKIQPNNRFQKYHSVSVDRFF